MAGLAGILDGIDPIVLGLHQCRNTITVSAGAGELALVRNFEERKPVDAWIVFGRRRLTRRQHGRKVEIASRRGPHLWRIDESVTPNPYVIVRAWKIGQEIAALF